MTDTSAVSTAPVSSTSLTDRFIGRVKWFNNKAGYGFITVTDGPKSGTDIFVHHSSIRVDAEQYKYLVQGEYTEFTLLTVVDSAHECQAAEVSGIKGGKLMCETRYDARSTRTTYKGADQGQVVSSAKQVVDAPAPSEWTPARKPRQLDANTSRPSSSGGRGSATGRGRGPSAGRGSTAGRGRGPK
jgi:CspA family cold shock protein